MKSELINMSMIKTGNMVAIMEHLARHKGVSLGDLEDRFNMNWKDIYSNLWEIHMTEVLDVNSDMFPSPFDIFGNADEDVFPLPENGKIPDDITKDTLLPEIFPYASENFASVTLSLVELVLIVHILDELLEVTPPSHGRGQLSDIRDNLATCAKEHGYGNVIWERAEDVIANEMLDTIIRALDENCSLTLSYSTFDKDQCAENIKEYTVVPLRLDGGARPVLRADLYTESGGARSFRLDRIREVRIGDEVSKRRIKQARQRMNEDVEKNSYSDSSTTIRITTTRQALWVVEELSDVSVEENGELLVMTIPARNYDFIATFVALMGNAVVHIDPSEVAEHVRAIFSTLASSYDDVLPDDTSISE